MFYQFGLPLAWMIGAMVSNTVLAMVGAPIVVPQKLRLGMVTVLGVMLGSAFTPDVVQRIVDWMWGGLFLAAFGFAAILVVDWYFRLIGGLDRTTAFFCSTPGGLNEMIILGDENGADGRVVALVHASRILFVVFTVPISFRLFYDLPAGAPSSISTWQGITLSDGGILAGCALIGLIVGRLLRLRAGHLLGPMGLSAAIHATGLTSASPPFELVAIAQIVIGSAIGCRFSGFRPSWALRIMVLAAGSTMLMLLVALLFSAAAWFFLDIGFAALVLAFSPGGLAEMSLIALALGVDTAFVSTMHIGRIFLVVIGAPVVYRILTGATLRRG